MYFSSISDSGENRITHNYGGGEVARLLGATGRKMVSECKEEGEEELPDGRTVTYTTATCTYDAHHGLNLSVYIDAAGGHEALLNSQVGAIIICFDFTGTNIVNYTRGSKTLSLPPPKDGLLFCALSSKMSRASLQCLADRIRFPKEILMLGLASELGKSLGDDWLLKNPAHGNWEGKSPSSQRILTLSIHRYF